LNIIAVETSTDICGIALIKNGKCVDLVEKRIPRKHAEQLPVFYDTLIKSSNFNEFKINAVAVSIGPGSFTGLREYSVLLYSHRDIVYTQAFKKNKTFKKPKAVQWEKIDHSKLIFHYGCEKLIRDEKHETLIPSAKKIGELAANNYEDWLIERPYDLVPNYISPFEL
jgi:tRNA A37 threonylcarbamoyladenosine modification protein TsaB